MYRPLFRLPKPNLLHLGNTQRDAKNKNYKCGLMLSIIIFVFCLMFAWMEQKQPLRVVLLVPNNNHKSNLTNFNITKCNRKIILGQKKKANKKIIMGRREYITWLFFFNHSLWSSWSKGVGSKLKGKKVMSCNLWWWWWWVANEMVPRQHWNLNNR